MEAPQKVSFIPCLTWVRKGVANSILEKIKPSKEELQEIIKEMKLREAEYLNRPNKENNQEDENNESDEEEGRNVDDVYDMDNYDDEVSEPPVASSDIASMLSGIQNDSDDESLDSDEEPGEFTIKPDDNLILCGHVDGDVCMLEVYVFNNEKGELFILNDIFLPSYPICIEWLDFNFKNAETPGHYAAVGYVTPEIGVWDLNLDGCLEPAFKLGSKKKKTMRHSDAVLDIAWNQNTRNVLASGSADNTVILWDMAHTTSITKITSFEEKVQSLKWHPVETQSLLTGCCDGKVRLYDCRNPKYFKTWGFEGEIERVLWNNFDPLHYFTTTNTGMVYYVDTRSDKPIWTLKAHDKEVTGIALSSHCKDLFVTGSTDEAVKVWDLEGGTPALVTQKNMSIGSIYALAPCPDIPYVFCAGGSKKDNHLYLWDARESDPVMARFKSRKFEEATVYSNEENDQSMKMETDNQEPQPSTSRAVTTNGGRIEAKKRKSGSQRLVESAQGSSKSKKSNKKSHKKSNPPKGPPK